MLVGGLFIYGKKITEKEFFLRRFTMQSIDAFLLLSAVSFISKAESSGAKVDEWKAYLEYYISVLNARGKQQTRVRPDTMERIHGKVFNIINRGDKV